MNKPEFDGKNGRSPACAPPRKVIDYKKAPESSPSPSPSPTPLIDPRINPNPNGIWQWGDLTQEQNYRNLQAQLQREQERLGGNSGPSIYDHNLPETGPGSFMEEQDAAGMQWMLDNPNWREESGIAGLNEPLPLYQEHADAPPAYEENPPPPYTENILHVDPTLHVDRAPQSYLDGGFVRNDQPSEVEKPPFDPNQPSEDLSEAVAAAHAPAKPEFDPNLPSEDLEEDPYTSLGDKAQTALRHFREGVTLGFSKNIKNPLGELPTDVVRQQDEANPYTAGAASLLGTGALLGVTGGLGGLAGASSTIATRLGLGAIEGASIGGIEQANDDWSENKSLDAQKIAATATLGGLLGLGAHGLGEAFRAYKNYKLGTPLAKTANSHIEEQLKASPGIERPVISELDRAKVDAGEFIPSLENTGAVAESDIPKIVEGLKDTKANAPEIAQAAENIGSPVLEGMVSDNQWVQIGEDALLKGAPSPSGIARQNAYQKVYDAVGNAVNLVMGKGSPYTKAELGNSFKKSIAAKIEEQVAPLNALYEEIKRSYSVIPLSERSAPAIIRNLKNLQGYRIAPSSPEGKIVKRVIDEIGNLKTVDDVKQYRSILNRSLSPTASAGEKRIVSILADKLSGLEERSIIRFAVNEMKTPQAKERILGLLRQREAANAAYAPFRKNLNTLVEQLGKGRVYGAQDALNFIEHLTPEEVTQKLFAKNDSEFLKFFSKNFPEQMTLMKDYQKGVIRDIATPSGTGVMGVPRVFAEIQKLEPEIQRAIFSPGEISVLNDANTVQKSIPKAFNTSNTANMNAFREFLKGPTGAAVGTARDAAIHAYIKAGGSSAVRKATTEAFKLKAEQMSKNINKGVKSMFEVKK